MAVVACNGPRKGGTCLGSRVLERVRLGGHPCTARALCATFETKFPLKSPLPNTLTSPLPQEQVPL